MYQKPVFVLIQMFCLDSVKPYKQYVLYARMNYLNKQIYPIILEVWDKSLHSSLRVRGPETGKWLTFYTIEWVIGPFLALYK